MKNVLNKCLRSYISYISLIYFIIAGLTLFRIYSVGIIPGKYIILYIIIILAYYGITLKIILSKKLFRKCIGSILFLLSTICLFWISLQLSGVNSFLSNQNKETKNETIMEVVTLKTSPYNKLSDIDNKELMINKSDDSNNILLKLDFTKQNVTPKYKEVNNYMDSVDNLINRKIQLIVVNSKYREQILNKFKNFDSETKVIYSYKIDRTSKIETQNNNPLISESFNILLSGNDEFGELNESGKSDVNIIATVNHKTGKILLTSIPRDMYVRLPINGGVYDKLTHASNLGIDASINAIEDLLNIKIPYYVRINFTSLIKLVDAIDGIEVDNPTAFNTYDISEMPYSFAQGKISLSGEQALAYSRERYFFGDERVRGENQQRVINGIINKITQPGYIINFGTILSNLGNIYSTNLSQNDISDLIKDQLDKNHKWDIKSFNLNGENCTGPNSYMLPGQNIYVMVPYKENVEYATKCIEKTLSGTPFIIDQQYLDPVDKTLIHDENLIYR